MKCPACSRPLHEFNAGHLMVDICRDGCSGIWFDKDELESCDAHGEPFPDSLLRLRKSPDVVIDRSKVRPCPRCPSTNLQRVVLDAETRFEIDTCPKCAGHWLDLGELEHMRKLSKQNAEVNARLDAFDKKLAEQIKDGKGQRSLRAFIKVLSR